MTPMGASGGAIGRFGATKCSEPCGVKEMDGLKPAGGLVGVLLPPRKAAGWVGASPPCDGGAGVRFLAGLCRTESVL